MRFRFTRAAEAAGSREGNNKGEVSAKATSTDDVALVCMLLRMHGCPEFQMWLEAQFETQWDSQPV